MNRVAGRKMICLLLVLAIVIPANVAVAATEEETFFSSLDSIIESKSGKKLSEKQLIVERYLRLLARLDIFGLYCDKGNKLGYSTRVADLQRGSVRLEKWTEQMFGSKGAYNRFESYRNEESLRYIRGDRTRTCQLSDSKFHFFTGMDPKDFRIHLSSPPFGSF